MHAPVSEDRNAARPPRAPRPQAVLSVRGSQWLAPYLVRLTVGGPGFAQFRDNAFTDKYAKLRFADVDERPITRTYTVRDVDVEAQQLSLDFVVHGTDGIAAPWAATARPGDTVTLSGAGGGYAPDATDDWQVFAGDESALPAISAALEALPAGARGVAWLEVAHGELPNDLLAPPGVELRILPRDVPGARPDLLATAIAAAAWPAGRIGVFAHGERESMKAVRRVLRERDLGGGQLSISGYWAYGRTEDRLQAEKREPIGQLG